MAIENAKKSVRTVLKSDVRKMVELELEFKDAGEFHLMQNMFKMATELSEKIYGDDDHWITIETLFRDIYGFNRLGNGTDEEVIAALKVFGIEVLDDEKNQEPVL